MPIHETPVLVLTAICLAGCGSGDSQALDLQAIRDTDQALNEAIDARDAELTASFYAEDASMLPMAEPIVSGVEAIQQEWSRLFAIPGFQNSAQFTRIEVSSAGDLGYTQGTYATTLHVACGGTEVERGKWVAIWKKQRDNRWKIVVDIYNTDELPPDHLPTTHAPAMPADSTGHEH